MQMNCETLNAIMPISTCIARQHKIEYGRKSNAPMFPICADCETGRGISMTNPEMVEIAVANKNKKFLSNIAKSKKSKNWTGEGTCLRCGNVMMKTGFRQIYCKNCREDKLREKNRLARQRFKELQTQGIPDEKKCCVEGCNDLAKAKRLCNKHYYMVKIGKMDHPHEEKKSELETVIAVYHRVKAQYGLTLQLTGV